MAGALSVLCCIRARPGSRIRAMSSNPPNVYGYGHEGYYRNVLAVLRGDAKPETDGRGGRKSLELILGIYESAKTGRDVSETSTSRRTRLAASARDETTKKRAPWYATSPRWWRNVQMRFQV